MANASKTIPWNATDYLKTPEDIADYLAAAFETGEAEDVTQALSTIARARGIIEIAKSTGMAEFTPLRQLGLVVV